MTSVCVTDFVNVQDVTDPLADSLGIPPERLDNGKCGCVRPRAEHWSMRPLRVRERVR